MHSGEESPNPRRDKARAHCADMCHATDDTVAHAQHRISHGHEVNSEFLREDARQVITD